MRCNNMVLQVFQLTRLYGLVHNRVVLFSAVIEGWKFFQKNSSVIQMIFTFKELL